MKRLILILAVLLVTDQPPAAQQPPSTYRIAGVVVDAVTGAPVPHAGVSVWVKNEERKTIANEDGRFRFEELEAGKYALYVAAQGYIREGYNQHGAYSTAVAVGSGLDSGHVLFRLHQQAVIHGRVMDERGDAVRHVQVFLFAANTTTGHAGFAAAPTQTDDLGEYRFAHLLPGKYYVALQAHPWYAQSGLRHLPEPQQGNVFLGHSNVKADSLLDSIYPITFYPGVTNERSAAELNLTAGETEEANVQLQAIPAVHLRLTNVPSDEKDPINISANQKVFGTLQLAWPAAYSQIAPGEYEIAGLPPGEVALIVSRGGNQGRSSQTIKADVTEGDTLNAAGTGATANVSGRVIVPDGATLAERGQLTLVSDEDQNAIAELLNDGTFSLGPLRVGTYKVSVNLHSNEQYVRKISASGAKTFGRQVTIERAGEVQLNIMMGKGLGQVGGVVQLEGKPAAGVMVLMVPESGENLEEDSRIDQSDSDGTFTLGNTLPGKYLLMAIEDGWELEWTNSSVLKPYREKGQMLRIAPEETKKVTVQVQRTIK